MAATDRAFRALGRDEPHTFVALVRALVPDFLPGIVPAASLTSLDARLDTPDPSREADLVLADDQGSLLWHIEGQGYDDAGFLDRVLRYHLGLVLRHWEREVRTVAVWLRAPAQEQRQPLLRKGALSVLVTHLILPEAKASRLVLEERTACFAPAADDEGRGDWVVCQQTVAVLKQSGASLRRWQMAAVAARSRSVDRYRAMVQVMEQSDVRSVIIEDLLKIGEEFGVEKGLKQGLERGRLEEARKAVKRVLARRGLVVTEDAMARLEGCSELATLERWLDQAITAASAGDALQLACRTASSRGSCLAAAGRCSALPREPGCPGLASGLASLAWRPTTAPGPVFAGRPPRCRGRGRYWWSWGLRTGSGRGKAREEDPSGGMSPKATPRQLQAALRRFPWLRTCPRRNALLPWVQRAEGA